MTAPGVKLLLIMLVHSPRVPPWTSRTNRLWVGSDAFFIVDVWRPGLADVLNINDLQGCDNFVKPYFLGKQTFSI